VSSVQKRPDGRYRVRWRDPDGKERAKHFAKKVDAERYRSTVGADIIRGAYVDPAAGRQSFLSYAEAWRASQPHRANTAARVASQLRRHVYPRIGSMPLGTVRPTTIQALVASWSRRPGRCVPPSPPSGRSSPPRSGTGRSPLTRAWA
jgi:hypothetical protein